MIKKLYKYLGEYKKYLFVTLAFLLADVIVEVRLPEMTSNLLKYGLEAGDMDYTIKHGIYMILASLTALVLGVVSARTAAVAGTGLAKNLRKDLFGKIQEFSFSNVDKFSTGSLISRVTSDVTNLQQFAVFGIRIAARSPLLFVYSLIRAFRKQPKLTVIFLVAIPAIILLFRIITKLVMPKFQMLLEKVDIMNSDVQENLSAIRVVKSFVREDFEIEKFTGLATNIQQKQIDTNKILAFAQPMVGIVFNGVILALYVVGSRLMVLDGLAVPDFNEILTYGMQILISLMLMTSMIIQMYMARASMVRIIEVLEEDIDIKDSQNPQFDVSDGSVVFENVSFTYFSGSKNYVLSDINLDIKSGETVGIIGGTGSSKTSLVQLIPRLYDVSDGIVKVGGKNVKDLDIEYLRDQVAMVLQKNVLFSGTIKENLKWGKKDATDEEIIEACKIAQAHDFVMSFEKGYDSWLDQGGINLSGGQKQRLCIARALLKKPRIIIMDDSTSAVDTTTDTSIRKGLADSLSTTTVFIVAQRINSVQDADKIIVIDDGKVNAVGTHDELLKSNDIYKEIYKSQTKGVA